MSATILLGIADLPFAQSLPLDGDAAVAAGREAAPPSLGSSLDLADAAVTRWDESRGLIRIGLGPSTPSGARRISASATGSRGCWPCSEPACRSRSAPTAAAATRRFDHDRAYEDDRARAQGPGRGLPFLADGRRCLHDGNAWRPLSFRPRRVAQPDRAGAEGDLVLLRHDPLAFAPLSDSVRQLVYGVPSRDIDTVSSTGGWCCTPASCLASTPIDCSRP